MIGDHGLKNQNEALYIARHEALCTLDDILRESAKILKVKGRFYMVHRPFRLPEIMTKMCAYGIEPKRMRLVYPYIDKEPNMVLTEVMKGGNPEDAGRTAVGCISERWKLYGGTACTLRNESVVSKENITRKSHGSRWNGQIGTEQVPNIRWRSMRWQEHCTYVQHR